jgi:hypothetical protein
MHTMNRILRTVARFAVASLAFAMAGCDPQTEATAVDGGPNVASAIRIGSASELSAGAPQGVMDAPLPSFQGELLELAFDVATAIPKEPHIKTRSRVQEEVVSVCWQIDQPLRALRYIEQIDDWRRGSGYADFAAYCARHGHADGLQQYLDLAVEIAGSEEDWRRDQVRVKVAQAYLWLDQSERAAEFEAGVVDSESGKVDVVRALLIDEDTLSDLIARLDRAIATENIERVKNALLACVVLFDRFYDDEIRRPQIEGRVRSSSEMLPVGDRLDVMMQCAKVAIKHDDRRTALELVNRARVIMEGYQWTAEDALPLMGRLAGLRFGAGDEDEARRDAAAILARFAAERDQIMNMYRAEALRPLAEAYGAMGDRSAALGIYRTVIEEGAENPNARPRAEDLCATLCSMAVNGVEPDAELWARVREIRQRLGDPW